MAWGNEVYVVASLLLKGKHNLRKLGSPNLVTLTVITDLAILAEDALQDAVTEEYGAGPPVPTRTSSSP
ncbi:MAG TPA: hypothetical protein GXX40_01755 [Firmicutes bacterium]|nr:hypothetical protein [Bacillota bacterium]